MLHCSSTIFSYFSQCQSQPFHQTSKNTVLRLLHYIHLHVHQKTLCHCWEKVWKSIAPVNNVITKNSWFASDTAAIESWFSLPSMSASDAPTKALRRFWSASGMASDFNLSLKTIFSLLFIHLIFNQVRKYLINTILIYSTTLKLFSSHWHTLHM